MKACSAVSPLTGMYMEYAYSVRAKNTPAYIYCDDLADVRAACKYLRDKFPRKCICVHRMLVIADVDTQMKKKNIEKLLTIMKSNAINKN